MPADRWGTGCLTFATAQRLRRASQPRRSGGFASRAWGSGRARRQLLMRGCPFRFGEDRQSEFPSGPRRLLVDPGGRRLVAFSGCATLSSRGLRSGKVSMSTPCPVEPSHGVLEISGSAWDPILAGGHTSGSCRLCQLYHTQLPEAGPWRHRGDAALGPCSTPHPLPRWPATAAPTSTAAMRPSPRLGVACQPWRNLDMVRPPVAATAARDEGP